MKKIFLIILGGIILSTNCMKRIKNYPNLKALFEKGGVIFGKKKLSKRK